MTNKDKTNRVTPQQASNAIFRPRSKVVKDSKTELYEIDGKPCAMARRGRYYVRVVSGGTLYSPYHERRLEPNVEWMECDPIMFGRFMKYLTTKDETQFKLCQRSY